MREDELDATTADGRAFLQHRVSRFGLVVGSLFFVFLVFRMVSEVIYRGVGILLHPSMAAHALAAAAMLAVWFVLRRGERSLRVIRTTETVGVLSSVGALVLMGGAYMAIQHRPDYILTLALAVGLFSRAVYVPSTPARTAALGIVSGLAVAVTVWVAFSRVDARFLEYLEAPDAQTIQTALTANTIVWWMLIVAVTTLATRVIYGLRQAVRSAQKLGQYHLLEELGHGAMGIVYRASHAMLRRDTAIKLLKSDAATDEDIDRFEREVRLTARLTHPHTITIFDYGRTPQGVFYYAMELLKGADLESVVQKDGRQPAGRVAKVLYEAASALEEAHGIGLVHRDIKPANIMLCEQGGDPDVTKLVDFGLVRHIEGGDDLAITADHVIVGTPYYMAPESFHGAAHADARSDIYAIGAVAYWMVTGEMVFDGRSLMEICTKHMAEKPVAPSDRLGEDVPEDLEWLILDCLAKDPDDRPPSARELRDRCSALSCFGEWTPEHAQRWWEQWQAADHGDVATAETELGTVPIDLVHRDWR